MILNYHRHCQCFTLIYLFIKRDIFYCIKSLVMASIHCFFSASSDPVPFGSICSSWCERVGNGLDGKDAEQWLQQHQRFVWPLWWDQSQRLEQCARGRLRRRVEVQSERGTQTGRCFSSTKSRDVDTLISLCTPLMTWQTDLLHQAKEAWRPITILTAWWLIFQSAQCT